MTRIMLWLGWIGLLSVIPPALGFQDTDKCARCGNRTYGTAVRWAGSPSEAAVKAKAEQKLVFVLHVSGHFEDENFT